MQNKTIETVSDFLEELKQFKRDKDHEYFFRGHSSKYTLRPSIYRGDNINHENKYFKEIISKSPHEFSTEKTTVEKLVKMQHYGLPTRLLDITSNPLVALYLACKEYNDKESKVDHQGEVFVFKINKKSIKFYDSDTVTILANIAKMSSDFSISKELKEYKESKEENEEEKIKKFNSKISDLLHEIKEDKSYFLPIVNPSDFSRVIAVKVKQNNHRIVRQNGAFFLFGFKESKTTPVTIPVAWTKGSFFILDKNKANIKNELDMLNINQSSLFPELDKQAEYLKNLYL